VTFGTLQARAAIRDVGRVLGLSFGDVDRIAKLVPEVLGITLDDAITQSPELRARMDADGQIRQLIETARSLEGLTRHASKHAAGVVIGTKPLIEMVPLYKDPKSGDVMSQYNMGCVEQVGLIKFDFLGLKTLTLMADAEKMIRRKPGFEEFDVNAIPLDDVATYEMLCSGDTEGVFQVESSGMTELVIKLKPRSFREVIPLVALYRPGPLQSGMVDDFVNRKSGQTKIAYLHPSIEELTEETLGVIVYQDQVLQIAQKMAGYSLGEADLLRRAMGKKKADVMQQQRERFVQGAVQNGIDKKEAGEVFDLIVEFAGYGFPKAHSTAYAYITYQTAYLKANHRAEYLAAVLARVRDRDPAAGRERIAARLRRRGGGDSLRLRGHQERRRRSDRDDSRGTRPGWTLYQPLRLHPSGRRAARQSARPRGVGQVRRLRFGARESRFCVGVDRYGARARRLGAARPRGRAGEPLRRPGRRGVERRADPDRHRALG
jgi:DNA polymerase-3 subunit alpha